MLVAAFSLGGGVFCSQQIRDMSFGLGHGISIGSEMSGDVVTVADRTFGQSVNVSFFCLIQKVC